MRLDHAGDSESQRIETGESVRACESNRLMRRTALLMDVTI